MANSARYLIPVLIFSLCLPNPALALRPEPPTEADRRVLTGLEESLKDSDTRASRSFPRRKFLRVTAVGAAAAVAGLGDFAQDPMFQGITEELAKSVNSYYDGLRDFQFRKPPANPQVLEELGRELNQLEVKAFAPLVESLTKLPGRPDAFGKLRAEGWEPEELFDMLRRYYASHRLYFHVRREWFPGKGWPAFAATFFLGRGREFPRGSAPRPSLLRHFQDLLIEKVYIDWFENHQTPAAPVVAWRDPKRKLILYSRPHMTTLAGEIWKGYQSWLPLSGDAALLGRLLEGKNLAPVLRWAIHKLRRRQWPKIEEDSSGSFADEYFKHAREIFGVELEIRARYREGLPSDHSTRDLLLSEATSWLETFRESKRPYEAFARFLEAGILSRRDPGGFFRPLWLGVIDDDLDAFFSQEVRDWIRDLPQEKRGLGILLHMDQLSPEQFKEVAQETHKRLKKAFAAQAPRRGGEIAAGLEEARFVPWEEAPDKVLVRPPVMVPLPEETQKRANDSLKVSRDLYDRIHTPIIGAYLRELRGLERPPLVHLPKVSAALGKPVFLWREGASFPTHSGKPRMLAALFDLYLYGDQHNLTGRRGLPLPEILATQSTGNHGLAMAWFRSVLPKVAQKLGLSVPTMPGILIYAMNGIPFKKKKKADGFGATVWDAFESYGQARENIREVTEDQAFLYWHHGTWPIILGNMTAAFDLKAEIDRHPALQGRRIGVVSPGGAGGRITGLALGLKQELPGRVKIVAAQTQRVSPVFQAVQEGRPTPIDRLTQRPEEDGIYVDQMEPLALEMFLRFGDAVARVEDGDQLSFTRWVMEELKRQDRSVLRRFLSRKTEAVTGISLAVPFRYPKLFEDVDAIIIDETGVNVDPSDHKKIKGSPLPEVATAGLEERQALEVAVPDLGVRDLSDEKLRKPFRETFGSP